MQNFESGSEENVMKIGLEFQIKRGFVDDSNIDDDETMDIIKNVKRLIKQNKNSEAVSYLLPKLNFEWTWSNGDGDPSDFFLVPLKIMHQQKWQHNDIIALIERQTQKIFEINKDPDQSDSGRR